MMEVQTTSMTPRTAIRTSIRRSGVSELSGWEVGTAPDWCRANFLTALAFIFHDVETCAAPIGAVRDAILIDKDVGRMQYHWPIGPRIHQLVRRRRHAGTNFGRLVGISDVIDSHPGILVGREDDLGTLKTAGTIFMHIVRSEMTANRDIVAISRQRECGDANWGTLYLVVEHPDGLVSVCNLVQHRLVENNKQV